jgi:hypothetical protein
VKQHKSIRAKVSWQARQRYKTGEPEAKISADLIPKMTVKQDRLKRLIIAAHCFSNCGAVHS